MTICVQSCEAVRCVCRVTRSQNEVESLSTQLEQIETKATQSAKSSTTLEANLAEAQGEWRRSEANLVRLRG